MEEAYGINKWGQSLESRDEKQAIKHTQPIESKKKTIDSWNQMQYMDEMIELQSKKKQGTSKLDYRQFEIIEKCHIVSDIGIRRRSCDFSIATNLFE